MLRIMKFDEAISQTFVHNLIKLQFRKIFTENQ